MQQLIQKIEKNFKKESIPAVQSGDTVKVTQRITEGSKERLQVFEGLVIRTRRMNSHTATIAVRRVASGIGVEKTFMLHSPLVSKVEVTKRSKVRRNYLTYMRDRSGKSARLDNVGFDSSAVNVTEEKKATAEVEPKTNDDSVSSAENDTPVEVTEEPAADKSSEA